MSLIAEYLKNNKSQIVSDIKIEIKGQRIYISKETEEGFTVTKDFDLYEYNSYIEFRKKPDESYSDAYVRVSARILNDCIGEDGKPLWNKMATESNEEILSKKNQKVEKTSKTFKQVIINLFKEVVY
jgi:hypothetical protein